MPWYQVRADDGAQVPQPRHCEPIRVRRPDASVEA
jgi:hypothetical protein